ncbi:MAG: indole-3-glycerol-phosphate synthase [Kiritimatiellaeota bacterium]|nr:indole-3-glycerol-phosphate synthase [Kiritimatiellota bacterium]
MRFSSSIITALQRGHTPVIVDIKCCSPEHGDLMRGRDPVECARLLAGCGAPALSVVTEERRFGGSMALLERVVKATGLPILRKDFIETEDELDRTRDAGAAAILLMVSVLPEVTLERLFVKAQDIGLEPLVEVHTETEMAKAAQLGAKLIGINNRDITRWECDNGTVTTTQRLARLAPPDATLISESGIVTPDDALAALAAGCSAVLIGSALWLASNLEQAYTVFKNENRKI